MRQAYATPEVLRGSMEGQAQIKTLQPFVPDCYTNCAMSLPHRGVRPVSLVLWVLVLTIGSAFCADEAQKPETAPRDVVRQAIAHEVAAANKPSGKFMFRSRKQTPKGSQSHLYVETNDALAGMLLAINDQPISAQQQQQEHDHLNWLINNPDQLRKKQAREKEDAERTLRIVKALPDAFRYEYAGLENGDAEMGKPGDKMVRLKFTPNPGYSPPSHVEQVLQGMQGYLVIDSTEKRLARIDGTLFRDVSFGWGILGHLDKGGHFRVQQADVGDGSWEITSMSLKMTGKILMFKSISMTSDENFADFQRVPDNLPFAKGVELLKSEQEKLAHNHLPEAVESKKAPQ
ncbi:MAG TPA: hypothetical protein VMP68_27825 [Candidatus Eisenbacteria bacterium]|nr:hypothetical protein [Candidatus Eisenbacteria bacterium]